MNNKKGKIKPSTWIISFLVFTGVFALLFVSSSSLLSKYDSSSLEDSSYEDSYNKFDEIMNPSGEEDDFRGLFSDLTDSDTGMLDIIFGDAGIFRGLFTLIKLTFASIGTLDDMAVDFISDFGVPETIANIIFPLITSILVIILIFAVISSVNRGSEL